MTVNLKEIIEYSLSLASKALPVALSFVDDLFFILLAKLNIYPPSLAWLGPTLSIGTIVFLLVRWWIKQRRTATAE